MFFSFFPKKNLNYLNRKVIIKAVIKVKTIFNDTNHIIEIEKSKFLGFVFHVESEEEFKLKLKAIQKEHPKATHHCYAYVLETRQKSNDDGEPSGTAGLPMLETIKIMGLTNVGVVAVRYFGGIKLGAGGLTRAYSRITSETIKKADIKEIISLPTFKIIVSYDIQNIVDLFLRKNSVLVLKKDYEISVEFLIAHNDIKIVDELIDLCNGKIQITQQGNQEIIM